ncbi:MAG: xylose isomerase [Planctomycetes bacterium TMED75]|nr:xylose isomerase [Planctomycetaceae bacterium]OUU91703.1 MAG: xylose isomerase [Planctomycetes bacterium TMED75]
MSEFFPGIETIPFAGASASDELVFRRYDPEKVIAGKTMHDQLRFASAYWHTMRNPLADPFGAGTAIAPWDDGSDSVENARVRVEAFFEFLEKCRIDWYCFHDRDVAPEGVGIADSERILDSVTDKLLEEQQRTGKQLLWGTACLFIHPRYVHGAATSCLVDVYAHAAAQVCKAMEVTHTLGGSGYVFWGGREGYGSLLNTDMKRELDHLARFLHLAVEHKHRIGFEGQFYIEPKPKEPTTHQYDSDSAACLNFLREYDLIDHFKLNIETNHAELAGHTMRHELQVARSADALGSIDANIGTPNLGWDTDCFPGNLYLATEVMLEVLEMGGFTNGGLNFDAKRRRESFEPLDLFHAHILGMDTFAAGLEAAESIRTDGSIAAFIEERYASWDSELGRRIESGDISLSELREHAGTVGEPAVVSGRQERLEAIFNRFLSG